MRDFIRKLRAALRRRSVPAAACALALLALTSCAQLTTAVNAVCGDVAAVPVTATQALDAQDPHSALGILWSDTKAACANGVPAPGVDGSWGGMVWGELKALIPQVVPSLLPLLMGVL
jgi:hypothetical protein